MAGTYTITVLTARQLSVPRIELGTSRVLGERHNQLDHTDWNGVSGFRSQYLVLAKDARFRLRQYPGSRAHSVLVLVADAAAALQGRLVSSDHHHSVHSTRVVFHPSKVKIRVRVPMDALFLPPAAGSHFVFLLQKSVSDSTLCTTAFSFWHARDHHPKKKPPTVGIEPTTTRLKVLRSTTELGGTAGV